MVCLMAVLPAAALALGRPATAWHWLAVLLFWGAMGLECWRFHRSQRRLPRAVACEYGVWQLAWADNHWSDADPVGVWHLWHWLQIIRLRGRDDGRRWTLIWLPDSAGTEDRRRLRVWLRLGRWGG